MSLDYPSQFSPKPEKKEKAIVTGGTEGIGRAIALELIGENHDVVICARTKKKLDEMKLENVAEAVQIDLGDTDKIGDFMKQSSDIMGGVTVLILNAAVPGIRESGGYTFRVDRDAQQILVESAADSLRASGGRIVFLTSQQAENPVKDNLAYGQSKRAVRDWLREFSGKKENKNIHVFSVNPGPVDTRMHNEAINYGGAAIKNRSIQLKNEGKLRDPKIVGRIISKMSISGKKFDPETKKYDMPIANNEIVIISDENIDFEKGKISKK